MSIHRNRRRQPVAYKVDSTYYYEGRVQPITHAALQKGNEIPLYGGHILQNNRTGRVGNPPPVQRFGFHSVNTTPQIMQRAAHLQNGKRRGQGRMI